MAQIPDVTVAVEPQIHKALANSVQAIADEFGIYVDDFSCDWIDSSDHVKNRAFVGTISMRTHSKGGDRG